nr:protein FAM246C-like [Globicephala melas]
MTTTAIVTTTVIITIRIAARTYRTLCSLPGLAWELVCGVSARELVEAMVVVERLEGKLKGAPPGGGSSFQSAQTFVPNIRRGDSWAPPGSRSRSTFPSKAVERWRGRGGAGEGLAGRRARPAGVTGRDRGASGLPGSGACGKARSGGGGSSGLGSPGARPERAKRPRPEAAPPSPTRRSPLQLPSEAFKQLGYRPATVAPAEASRARRPGHPTGPRLRLGGPHLPPEAPGGRGRRALGGFSWSALGAESARL